MDVVEELYAGDVPPKNLKNEPDLTQVQDLQQGLQQSVRAMN